MPAALRWTATGTLALRYSPEHPRQYQSPQGRDDVDARMVEAARNGLRFEADTGAAHGTQLPGGGHVSSGQYRWRETALLSVVSDITERRQAEEALLESERWLTESQRVAQLGALCLRHRERPLGLLGGALRCTRHHTGSQTRFRGLAEVCASSGP